MFDAQIIDSINILLRRNHFGSSDSEQVYSLKENLGKLLFAMTEENLPDGDQFTKVVKDLILIVIMV